MTKMCFVLYQDILDYNDKYKDELMINYQRMQQKKKQKFQYFLMI